MQPPPFEPHYQPIAPRRSNTVLWVVLGGIVGCCVLLVIGGGIAGYMGFKQVGPLAECTVETSVVAHALDKYVKEHNGKLPPAESWQTAIAKDYDAELSTQTDKERNPFKIAKGNEPLGCGKGASATGLTFNSEFSGKKLSDIKDAYRSYVIFESKQIAVNASAPYQELPERDRSKVFGQPISFVINGELEPQMIDKRGQTTPIRQGGRGRGFRVETGSNSSNE